LAAACIAVTAGAAPTSASTFCPSDINNDLTVDTTDLLAVIHAWGACSDACDADLAPGLGDGVVNASDLLVVTADWGHCPDHEDGGLTPCGPILLGHGAEAVINMAISGTGGIAAHNGTNVTRLVVRNCTIDVDNAGIYAAPCQEAIVRDTQINSDGGIDPYSVRGEFRRWVSKDSVFRGDKAWRIYGLSEGSSTRDTFAGGRLLCGGGPANEWENAMDFDNFTFRNGRISVDSVEIHAASNNITFRNMDFTGTDHISIHGPAHHINFIGCSRNGQPVTPSHLGGNTNFIRLFNNTHNINVIP
jgi:hypothetical protein